MNLKQLFDTYNARDTLILISPYPKKGELYSSGTSGLASYAKNVINPMNRRVVVLANILSKKEIYEEGNSLVIRCFKPGNPFMWVLLLKELLKFNKTKHVLVQFDFTIYGDIFTSSCMLPFLGILKLLFYDPSIILHAVVADIRKIREHVGLTTSRIDNAKAHVYNAVFFAFYAFLSVVTHRVIVLEETLKNKLEHFMNREKIIAIPHGVDTNLSEMQKKKARQKLGIKSNEYCVLFFGFINWFKGSDFFAHTFRDQNMLLGKNVRFLIAGGKSATMKNKPYYDAFYKKVVRHTGKKSAVSVTGYVMQEDIQTYFSAADIVVFPYRHFMMASGVLSLTFSYNKPFIVSQELSEMFNTPDFTNALQATGLNRDDFVFKLTKDSCIKTTEKVLKNGIKKKMTALTTMIRDTRSYQNTARLYEYALFQEEPTVEKAFGTVTITSFAHCHPGGSPADGGTTDRIFSQQRDSIATLQNDM